MDRFVVLWLVDDSAKASKPTRGRTVCVDLEITCMFRFDLAKVQIGLQIGVGVFSSVYRGYTFARDERGSSKWDSIVFWRIRILVD